MLGLVLSGGGAKGAFEVGVLKRLVEEDRLYDPAIIAGTSVGALNAAFLAQYPMGLFAGAVRDLEQLWLGIAGSRDIYRKRTGAYLRAAVDEDSPFGLPGAGLYDVKPLRKLVEAQLDPHRIVRSGRRLVVAACSMKTGRVKTWRESATSVLRDAVMASAAFPGYFLLVTVDGERYTDGGVREIAPVRAALDVGATELDVVLASPRESWRTERSWSVLEVAWAVIDAMSNEIKAGDLERLAEVPHRLFEPKEEVLEDSLDFDPAKIRRSIQLGYECGGRGRGNS